MKKYIGSFLIAIGLVFSLNATSQESKQSLILENCHLKGIKGQVQCGTLSVPENYKHPDRGTIELNVAVLPAIDSSQDKLPMMFLAGGPGQAATTLAATVRRTHFETLKTRDIILVDQRGTGKSAALQCESLEQGDIYTLAFAEIDFENDVTDCIEQIDYDLTQFSTENAVRDFETVRQALGYQQVHIYGGSYGTRAGLVFLRMFPDSIATATLDSVGPIELPIGLFGKSSARSFELLLEACSSSASCVGAFPNLRTDFESLVVSLAQTPFTLEVPHPRLGNTTSVLIDKQKLINSLRFQLYSALGRTMLPLVIHEASKGNFKPFIGLLSQSDLTDQINSALMMNIICNEDMPRVTSSALAEDANNSFGEDTSQLTFLNICAHWPTYSPSAEFADPVNASVPTLLLSGNLDPVTPPSNAELSNATLPNSRHIVANNVSHIVAGKGCASELINEFIESGDVESIDASCLDDIPAQPFMTSLNGSI